MELKKAVIYTRVSTREQEKEGFSIPAQEKLLRGYAFQNNLKIIKEFSDTETAKQTGRKSFNEMLRFLANIDDCNIILVEKTDRLYRNIKDWVTVDDIGVEIHFVKENVILSQSSRSSEKFMHGIKVLMAKNYIDNLSEEIKKGMKEKIEQGIYPSHAPIGYKNFLRGDGKKVIVIDSEKAQIVKAAFELYATKNYSLLSLVEYINDELGYTSITGHKFKRSSLAQMLGNPIYYGEFIWGKKLYKGIHEPIVSKELWDKVQMVFKQKKRTPFHFITKKDFAFSQLIQCGWCGCSLVGDIKKGKYVYYRCTHRKGKCPDKYIREERLSELIAQELLNLRIDPDILNLIIDALKESHEDEKKYHGSIILEQQKKYNLIQNRIEKMYVDKLDGLISEKFYQEKCEEWSKEQAETLRKIEIYQNANRMYFNEGIKIFELGQNAHSMFLRKNTKEQREMIKLLCSNLYYKDGKVTAEFRKPFDIIAVTNIEYLENEFENASKSQLSPVWWRIAGSNR